MKYRENVSAQTYVIRDGEKPFNIEAVISKESPEWAQTNFEEHFRGHSQLGQWFQYDGEWRKAYVIVSPLDNPYFIGYGEEEGDE